ncbi:MAG: histidine kinase, partial [Anaerolineae bacterium]|nr:histidine kinase [Anaerolineae bacterium]
LYWIAQEALNNTLKHAQASRIEIVLTQDANKVMLSIADDGVGFDAAGSPRAGTLGLRSMQERAAKLGW